MASKGDTPEYVRRMQQELFEVLGQARCREELHDVEPLGEGDCQGVQGWTGGGGGAGACHSPQVEQAQILLPVS